jgi:hypothetical protein
MSGSDRQGRARRKRGDGTNCVPGIPIASIVLIFGVTVPVAVPAVARAQESGPSTQDAFSRLESSSGSREAGAFPFDYQHLVFYPSPSGEADLWTAVSVHAGRVRGVFEGGWKYELEMRTVLFRDGVEVARDESRVRHILNALIPPRTTDGFPIQTRVRVLPGEYRYRIEVRDLNWEGDRALNIQEGEVVVPPFDRTEPFVSSVAVAADSGGTWSPSPGIELKLNAAKMVQTDARPFVYFEVYGLTPGETHRGEVRLVSNWAPMGKGESFTGVRQPFQLQYRGTTPDEPERPVRSVLRLEMKDTRPGPYKVLVRFTDAATGTKTEVRETEIRVRDPGDRGAEQPIAEVRGDVRGGR